MVTEAQKEVIAAARGLDGVLQVINSGMSLFPPGGAQVAYDSACDRLRASVEAYEATPEATCTHTGTDSCEDCNRA